MDFAINLKAGEWTLQETAGRMFLLVEAGTAGAIELRFSMQGGNDEEIKLARRGFRARLNTGRFSGVYMRAAVATSARFVISDNDIEFDFVDGSTVKAEIQNLPLPVSNDRGTPGAPIYVTGALGGGAGAAAVGNFAPIACGPAAVVAAAANVNRIELRFTNFGPDPVALGAAGITWANRAVVLHVGDMWVEDRGPALAWSAITEAGKTASLGKQEVTA